MTQENKKLLLKDLAARLPYGVIIHLVEPNEDEELYCLNIPQEGLYTRSLEHNNVTTLSPIEDIKPYLRPMSSMTEEEYKEYSKRWNLQDEFPTDADIRFKTDVFDWLNSYNFDYRGLIEKGLALKAPKELYKY